MVLGKVLVVLVSIAAYSMSAAAQPRPIGIVVEPSSDSRFKVSITFRGDADGTTLLKLPNEWGGQKELFRTVKTIKAETPGVKVLETTRPEQRPVQHKPGERVTVSYQLEQDYRGPQSHSNSYRPALNGTFIHWIGNAVWAMPEMDEQTELEVSIDWRKLPAGWTVANSFGVGHRSQKFETKAGNLGAAIFVAGDFRLVRTIANSKRVDLAVRGNWSFSDKELADVVGRIISIQRQFWRDSSQDRFLVTLIPLDDGPNASSFGGTALTDSFALFATPNADVSRLRGLLAHEYFHNWNPLKLGRLPEPEQQLYWFSEGFTEFYTYELLRRGDLITLDEHVSKVNELLREYYMSPVRTASNDRIVRDFWNDRNVQRLPYLRGFAFAMDLNAAIKRSSANKRSLDDVMFDLAAASDKGLADLSLEVLAAKFGKYLGTDPLPQMKEELVEGKLIMPASDAIGPGATLEMAKVPVFQLGFDVDRFIKDRVVADLDPASAAYAAGLRNGQQRAGGVSIYFGDTTREIELKVLEGDTERTIRFLPVAPERSSIPQYVVRR